MAHMHVRMYLLFFFLRDIFFATSDELASVMLLQALRLSVFGVFDTLLLYFSQTGVRDIAVVEAQ